MPNGASHPGVKLDWGGVGIIGVALVAIIYPLIQGRTEGWPLWIFAMLAAGVVLIGVFVLYERRRTHDPLIEPSLLGNRSYLSGLAVLVSFFGAFGGLLLCVSLYGQLGEGWSPIHAGLTLTPMVVGMILGMVGGFALLPKLGRRLLQLGVLLVMGGAAGLALTTSGVDTASTWDLVPSLFFIGMGAGMALGQLFQFILAGGEHERRRLGLRPVGGQSAAGHRARCRRAGHDLLLGLRPSPAAARAVGDRLGMPGTAGGRVSGSCSCCRCSRCRKRV